MALGNSPPLNGNPQFVEIQIRTQLQHAWATAVEAVGRIRGEDLKSGQGNEQWLRLFALMASEMAAEEGGAVVPGTPASDQQRRREIVDLERSVDALATLSKYRNAVKVIESTTTSAPYYLIEFDRDSGRLYVQGVSASASTTRLDEAELLGGRDAVLVAVDRAADLRAAYPNYFLDMGMFESRLRWVVHPSPQTGVSIDANWLRGWFGRKGSWRGRR